MNVWRDNEEHRKTAQEEVIGYEEDPKKTHDEEEEDQDEEDVTPNFETDDDNDDADGLDSDQDNDSEMTEDEVVYLKLRILKI